VTCLGGPAAVPVVFIRGTDRGLWQRSLRGGGWISHGGHLASPPAALPAVAGKCPGRFDVFTLGPGHAVWEFAGAWHRVGGTAASAPAAVRLPSGETDLFIRGTDHALWMNVRAPGAAAFKGWHRVGGFLASAPTAVLWPFSILGKARTVLALGKHRESADRPQHCGYPHLGLGAGAVTASSCAQIGWPRVPGSPWRHGPADLTNDGIAPFRCRRSGPGLRPTRNPGPPQGQRRAEVTCS
jgi:hypothetical protein